MGLSLAGWCRQVFGRQNYWSDNTIYFKCKKPYINLSGALEVGVKYKLVKGTVYKASDVNREERLGGITTIDSDTFIFSKTSMNSHTKGGKLL